MFTIKTNRYYPWILVALLWVVALLNYMDRQMLSTMQGAMEVDITELNKAEAFGALMAVFLWIYGLVSPFAGIAADRFSRKWLVIISLFVWSAVTFLMGFATTFHELYFLRAIMGVSEALYIPASLSLISDWHQGKSRSLAIGIHMTGLYVGQAIGGFGAKVAEVLSWHETFHWFGVIGLVYAVVLMPLLFENPIHEKNTEPTPSGGKVRSVFSGVSVLLSTWTFWVILIYFASPSLPGWATKNWLPTLFADSIGIPMSEAGPMSTITIACSSFIGVILGGVLSDRWVQRNIRGRIYTGAIGLALMIPALLLLGYGHHIFALVMAGVFFGIGFGMFDANNMPILCQFISTKYRATAYGIMNMTGVFAGAAVTHVLGKWTDGGELGHGFMFLSLFVLLALAFQLYFLRPTTDNMQ